MAPARAVALVLLTLLVAGFAADAPGRLQASQSTSVAGLETTETEALSSPPPEPATRAAPVPPLCILDTGIDASHADLDDGKVVAWKDFVQPGGAPGDANGHGTHVAGIAAGRGASGKPGVAPQAPLAIGRVMDERGHGTSAAAVEGIAWCLEQGANVINLSLEEELCAARLGLDRAIARALAQDVLVVVTAGNHGTAPCAIHTPGSLAEGLTVGALDGDSLDAERVAGFSSRGALASAKPDLVAPGVGIRAAKAGTRDSLRSMDGTSMAAPFVSGVAWLLRAAHPEATPTDLVLALRATARDGGAPGFDTTWGWGAVDPAKALAALAEGRPDAAPSAVVTRALAVLG